MYTENAPAPQKKILVVLSGGLDSATVLGLASRNAEKVSVVNFNYGQRHVREVESAQALCEHYNVSERLFLDISEPLGFMNRAILDYEGDAPELLPKTWKPGRNMVFLSIAASLAYSQGASIVACGVHQEDYPGYPDCRAEFLRPMEKTASEALGTPIRVWAPFLNYNKTQIVAVGAKLGVPYDLTWTCYAGGKYPCRVCDACTRRERAFSHNGLVDPLLKAMVEDGQA